MHRQFLRQLLDRHQPSDAHEKTMLADIICFIDAHEDCFERSQLKGHITGSAWITDSSFQQALLLHHRKLDRWLQPGGHSDGQSNTLDVATREAEEETGLSSITPYSNSIFDVDIHKIPARKSEPEHYHYDVRFLFIADPSEKITRNEESNAIKWFPLEEIQNISDEESISRMIRKVQSLK